MSKRPGIRICQCGNPAGTHQVNGKWACCECVNAMLNLTNRYLQKMIDAVDQMRKESRK